MTTFVNQYVMIYKCGHSKDRICKSLHIDLQMRFYSTIAFVNQFNFKNATAFFTNAFKRKAALNKGSLFLYFVLVTWFIFSVISYLNIYFRSCFIQLQFSVRERWHNCNNVLYSLYSCKRYFVIIILYLYILSIYKNLLYRILNKVHVLIETLFIYITFCCDTIIFFHFLLD